ncbi:MAG TPA: glycosyltransferase [Polyangiales bacterium]
MTQAKAVKGSSGVTTAKTAGTTRGLSVVVPAVNQLSDVVDCLVALERERRDVDLEVIVVDRLGERVRRQVRGLFPWVKLIEVTTDQTIPQMRALAFRAATRDAVAVIEDHVIVPQGWARQMLDALDAGADVVGGSVDNAACDTLMDWAAFLCEYSHLIPPIEGGSVGGLTGNNVVYRRELLERYREVTEAGEWENYLHEKLKQDGVELICRPEIVVGHKKHYTFGEYMSQRFLYARSYAGKRAKGSPLKKLAYGAGSAALPPLLLYRIVTRIAAKHRHQALLAKSTPLIAMFVTSWAAGEVVGSLFGEGDSLSKVC